MKPIATPSQTRQLLRQYGLSLKKSLGQNFLIDANILRRLVTTLDVTPETGIIEVGPGLGALTQVLAQKGGSIVAVEIDDRLLPALQGTFADCDQVEVVHADFLKLDLAELAGRFAPEQDLVAAANLPYYITTPILLKLLQENPGFRAIMVMVQKEVASRIISPPDSKDYGSLSVAVQYYAQPQVVADVPKTAFLPNPGVDSAVLYLALREQPAVDITDQAFFFRLVRACFAQRRKTLLNNLARFLSDTDKAHLRAHLHKAGIDPARRAETLSITEFACLSDILSP